jgi:hypothetical protein
MFFTFHFLVAYILLLKTIAMRKLLFSSLLFAIGIFSFAQDQYYFDKVNVGNTQLLPVHKGDTFFLRTNKVIDIKRRPLLATALKTVGIALASYTTEHIVSDRTKILPLMEKSNLLVPIGIGLGISANKLSGFKSKPHTYLKYQLYNKNMVLISADILRIDKLKKGQETQLTGIATEDGFIKPSFVDAAGDEMPNTEIFVSLNKSTYSASTEIKETSKQKITEQPISITPLLTLPLVTPMNLVTKGITLNLIVPNGSFKAKLVPKPESHPPTKIGKTITPRTIGLTVPIPKNNSYPHIKILSFRSLLNNSPLQPGKLSKNGNTHQPIKMPLGNPRQNEDMLLAPSEEENEEEEEEDVDGDDDGDDDGGGGGGGGGGSGSSDGSNGDDSDDSDDSDDDDSDDDDSDDDDRENQCQLGCDHQAAVLEATATLAYLAAVQDCIGLVVPQAILACESIAFGTYTIASAGIVASQLICRADCPKK